ncbi:MAG: AmmeMemoRadiSam system protein B [SAR324 cluster bacterium]|nr:AmmeMemoRadiSam system protein B [SAR324 cluster bacterium]MBL7034555.1 AmmeMemoRadiSam system protein B [SAR324 cluster bacterium]
MITVTPSQRIRPTAVASMFYPGNSVELRNTVRKFLREADSEQKSFQFENEGNSFLRALIVPHAGYSFSGKIAASAYRLLQNNQPQFKRVLLLGPAHRVWLQGAAFPEADVFETPLGGINLDKTWMRKLTENNPWISVNDTAHAEEHSLEVQLPFLQETLGAFELLPLVVGETKTEQLAEIIQQFSADLETLIVVSTDLSHFHDYQTAQQKDAVTANAIELLDPQKLSPEDACGAYPLCGALVAASQNKWKIQRLGLCNSGDTSGDYGRVVGYGAWVMTG